MFVLYVTCQQKKQQQCEFITHIDDYGVIVNSKKEEEKMRFTLLFIEFEPTIPMCVMCMKHNIQILYICYRV